MYVVLYVQVTEEVKYKMLQEKSHRIHRRSNNYSEVQMSYITKDFILDDETYFTLTKHQMIGNDVFYTKNLAT